MTMKIGRSMLLYAMGCTPLDSKKLSFELPIPDLTTGILDRVAAHPDVIAARAKRNNKDRESVRAFFAVFERVRKQILAEESAEKEFTGVNPVGCEDTD